MGRSSTQDKEGLVGLNTSVDDLDRTKKNFPEGTTVRGDNATCSPPVAQASGDASAANNQSSLSAPEEQQSAAASGRKKVSELRAIAHGAGYNTRGMERQDLEQIVAYVKSGSYNHDSSSAA